MARGVQYGARRVVHVAVRGPGQQGLAARPLSGEDEVVQLDLPVRGSGADHEGTADLTPVAAVVRAQADGEEIPFLHPAVGGPVPGAAGVRAGADGGGEGRAVGAVVHQAPFQLQGEVAFGAADEDGLQEFAEGLVGDLGGDPQTGDLLLVLDQPLLFDGGSEVGQPQPGRHRAQGAVPGDGEVVFLDGERVRADVLARGVVGRRDGRITARAGEHGQPQVFVEPALVRFARGRGGAEEHVLGGPDQQYRALGEGPGEIADVGRTRDQCGGVARCGTAVAKQAPTGRVHV